MMEPISGVSGLPSALKIQGRGMGGHQWAGLGQGEKSSGGQKEFPPNVSFSIPCRIPIQGRAGSRLSGRAVAAGI